MAYVFNPFTGNFDWDTTLDSSLFPLKVDPSTDHAVVRFDGVAGVQQDSGVIVDDSNNVTGVNDLSILGTTIGLNQSVTNRAIATWNANGGLRDNAGFTVDGSGIVTIIPASEMNGTLGFNLTQTTNQGFFKHLNVAKLTANGGSSFSTTKALQIYSIAGQTNIFIDLTGGGGSMIRKVDSGGDQVDLKTDGLTIKDSSSTFASAQINLGLTGSPPKGNFINAVSDTRTEFKLDASGNMLLGGAFISPAGGLGTFENHALYSEQIDQDTVWQQYGASTSVTTNVYPSPDGTPNKADRFFVTNNPGGIFQEFTDLVAANNTVSVSFWGRRTLATGQTLRCTLRDSTDSERSAIAQVNLNGQEDKWEFHTITYTFSGSATGNVFFHAEFQTNQDANGSIYGVHIVEGSTPLGYVATQNYIVPKVFGSVSNGNLRVGSGNDAVTVIVLAGDEQSTTNLVEIKDNLDVLQVSIDSNFTLSTLGRVEAINTFTLSTLGRVEAINTTPDTANYTLLATDDNRVADTSGGVFTYTLPASPEDGRIYTILLETAGNTLTIDGNGNNIMGSATTTMGTAYDAVQLIYNGTQWLAK